MDTICAISTPIGHGGIGIVRISGKESLKIALKLTNNRTSNIKPNNIIYSKIYDDNQIIDEALISYFKAPNSYTGDDVIEINSHGGILIVQRILNLVLKNGARMAEPGEFTKRAFLCGKIDLYQAEAVADLINSKTYKENEISAVQLSGDLGKKIREIKNEIVDVLVDIEANVDYPEYDIEEITFNKINKVIEDSIDKLQKLSNSYKEGKVLKNGINTAIVGKPNVGKSSILNVLLNEERAIVTDVEGTTRDTIEESIIINNVVFNLIDTAGIRETKDKVENIGIEKSKKSIEKADLVLFILDASKDISAEDKELFKVLKDHKKIIIINKNDIHNQTYVNNILDEINKQKENEIVYLSTKSYEGVDKLKDTMTKMFINENLSNNEELIITNIRHKEAIDKTIRLLNNAKENIAQNIPIDMISIDLQNSLISLCEILGENVTEDVINGIFSKFCLGK